MERKEGLQKENKKSKANFDFTKSEYEYFCDECMLNEFQAKILKSKILGKTTVEIALEQNFSTATIDREIKKILNKIKRVI